MQIINVYNNFANQGGAQDVTIMLAESLPQSTNIILTLTPIDKIFEGYKQRNVTFDRFCLSLIWRYRNCCFICHSRALTTILLLCLFVKRKNILHVSHNVFDNHRYTTLFPPKIVAVSNGVKSNLINFFRINPDRIKVIWNGLEDKYSSESFTKSDGYIKILLAGRICAVKQQLILVQKFKGRMPDNVTLYFAGDGEDRESLISLIENDCHFQYLGLINIYKELNKFDYVLLFSKREGLPLSLIEGCMFGKPLITNNLDSVMDVNVDGYNGFVFEDYESLLEGIKNLHKISSTEYDKLSRNARNKYLSDFTKEAMLKKYIEIID